jgi:type I restriction enzyme S subunit
MRATESSRNKLPDSWVYAKILDILEVHYGKGLPKRDRVESGDIPVYGSNGIVGFHREAIVTGPSIIIGRKGAAGAVEFVSTDCWPIDTTYYVQPSANLSLRYVFHALSHLGLDSLDRSTAVPSLSRDDLYAQKIKLAPKEEQRRIADEIDKQYTRLDAAVANLKRAQANLERYKASVLKAACEGRLVPQDPDDEPAGQLLTRILVERRRKWEEQEWAKLIEKAQKKVAQAKRKTAGLPHKIRDLESEDWQDIPERDYKKYLPKNDKWKEKYKAPEPPDTSGLPDLPSGWVWVTWLQVGSSQNGRFFPSKEYQQMGFKLLRPGNLHMSGSVVWTEQNTRFMPGKWAAKYPNYIVGENELVINLTAQSLKDEFLGRVCLTSNGEQCLLNQRIARLTPLSVSSKYILWLLKSWRFRRFVNSLNTGSLIQHMFTSQIDEFILPLPPIEEQNRIVKEIESRLSLLRVVEHELELALIRAKSLRKSILEQAFSGQLLPQDPNDQSASALLARIQNTKTP